MKNHYHRINFEIKKLIKSSNGNNAHSVKIIIGKIEYQENDFN